MPFEPGITISTRLRRIMIKLEDKWVWDFWLAKRLGEYHIFYLQAPRSLGDERLRHRSATIGHAVSTDLTNWTVLPDALQPGPPGAGTTWRHGRGPSSRSMDGGTFSTPASPRPRNCLVQRIGVAVSDDLKVWHKHDANPTITADSRWYELLGEADWHNQAWRDPWVYQDERTGNYHALITARCRHGATGTRGVVARATSSTCSSGRSNPLSQNPGCPEILRSPNTSRSVCPPTSYSALTGGTRPSVTE